MRRFLPLSTALFCFALAEKSVGQPKPFNATPNDYVPPSAQEIPQPEILPGPPANLPAAGPAWIPANIWPDMPPEISPSAEKWRYVYYGGRWWYRQPTNRWSYWTEGHWVDYVVPGRSNAPPYVQPPPAPRRWRLGARPPYRYPGGPGPTYPGGAGTYPPGAY